MAETYKDLPVLPFASKAEWAKWLRSNHSTSDGVWIKFAKKKTGIPTVTYDEALEVALCYGWIDGQAKGFDDTHHLQRWTRRRAKSVWSKINRENALRLIEEGKMKPAGLREVERAKADGRWDAAYDSPRNAAMHPDFEKALKRNAKARTFFETLTGANRFAILNRIQTAKREETRARRIKQFVEMLERGERLS
ncbi:MAG TPA: YdeI/OmpD-associated family protein [Actinomycetota bacterium]|nr:YdeI/OmpD-associated family protein [Actinomycetota bacterium]